MGFQLFLRIFHSCKNIRCFITIKLSSVNRPSYLMILLTALYFHSPLLHAESYTEFNVLGDEIIIFADDTFKPAPRSLGVSGNLGANESPVKEATIKNTPTENRNNISPSYKTPRGGRLGDALDTSLSEKNINVETNANSANNDATEVVTISSDDLWQRIKNGYAMPESTSKLTANHENWYSSRPDYIKRMVERSQRYLFHIVEEVEKRGMPTEIALLPMIESAYNPQANSTSNASGIWQFIPSTGKHFGLKQNWWVDNRRNITFATEAALTYLQKLHAMFGAWDLALAAYNAGEGTVGRAIEKNRKLGLPTDYESLNLPPETRNYVPKLQAVKNIMTNPENYGIDIQTIANTPYFAKVNAPAQIDSRLAARLAEISDDEFLALNPSYKRPVVTSSNENHDLLLPILSAQTFRTNLANYDKPLVSWQTYHAKRGERMEAIANKFGINVTKLRNVNNLPTQNKIKSAATILVPNGKQTDFKSKEVATDLNTDESTTFTQGHVLTSQQNAANIDMVSLQNMVADSSKAGENELVVSNNVTHKVKKGEVMQSIAKRYGVSVKQIMVANSLKTNRLKAGQLLNINTDANSKTTKSASYKNATKKQIYIVKRGDTLHSIAEKFDVAITDIKRWNKKVSQHIQPGNKLTIMSTDAL